MLEREIWQPNHRHLPADAQLVAGSPRAQRVCAWRARLLVFSEAACVGDAQAEEICADMLSLVCWQQELLIPLPAPPLLPCDGAATGPRSPGTPERDMPLLGPSLALCHPSPPARSCSPPLADEVLGVGV